MNINFVVLSSFESIETKKEYQKLKIFDFVNKPLNKRKLVNLIKNKTSYIFVFFD
jgi:DNA-binding NtrC family response regulator